MSTIAIQLLVQVILILINAFFAATEIAVISLNANKLRMLEESGDKLAPRLLKMLEQPAGFLSTIQIGITLAGFLGSAFAADSFSEYLVRWICEDLDFTALPISVVDTFSVVVITLILSYFTLIFGELVPKRIAMQKSLEMARLSCRVVSTLAFIARPVVALLSLSTNGVLRLLRMKTEDEEEQVTEDEIRMMIDLGNENGAIDAEEKELLQNVFEFGDLSVSDAMIRVGDVTAIQVDTPPGEVLDVIRATGLSRFPVYGSDLNDILGILNARDLLLDMASSRHRTVRELMRPAYLVPETLSADDLFRDMQHIYQAVITAWMYATPLFYDLDSIKNTTVVFIIKAFNPLYYYVAGFRDLVYYGRFPGPRIFWGGWIIAFLALGIGLFYFKKVQDKFILYI